MSCVASEHHLANRYSEPDNRPTLSRTVDSDSSERRGDSSASLEESLSECKRNADVCFQLSTYTCAMRNRFVAPGVPNGIPALMSIESPACAKPSSRTALIALSTICVTSDTSLV